jgi:hypothetical protein
VQANQILDLIETDTANIDSYDNLNLENCDAPAPGEVRVWVLRRYEWCARLRDEAGTVMANDTRSVDVTDTVDGYKAVQVLLEANNAAEQVVMKRVYVP